MVSVPEKLVGVSVWLPLELLVVTDGVGSVTWDTPIPETEVVEMVDEITIERLVLLLVQVKVTPSGGAPKLTYWH